MKNTLRLKQFNNFLLAAIVFVQASVFAQPAIQWDKTIGGPVSSFLYSSQQTADGGYIVGGSGRFGTGFDKTDPGVGSGDYWIVKLAADGTKEWDQAYGGPNGRGFGQFKMVRQTSDGGYILGGSSSADAGGDKSENYRGGNDGDGNRQTDYWIIKVSANGTKQWDKTLGGTGYEELTTINQTTDGGYILGGVSSSGAEFDKTDPAIGRWDFWVVKLAANGARQWDKTFGKSGFEYNCIAKQTPDGGYILGGTSSDPENKTSTNYMVLRLSSNGNLLWQKVYGSDAQDELSVIELTEDGGYLVGGSSNSRANGDKSEGSVIDPVSSVRTKDYWLIRLTSDGLKEWDKTIGGTLYDAGGYLSGFSYLTAAYQTSDGGYILGGYTNAQKGRSKTENNKGNNDYWIVKIDAKGNQIWDKTIGGNGIDHLQSISQTADEGYFLAGFSYSNKSSDKTENKKGEADFWVVKLAPEKLTETAIRINAGGPEFTTATKKKFSADLYYSGIDRTSSIVSGDILNTSNDVLYQSARCSPSFSYNIPVPNGEVSVYLHFAETYFGAPGKKGGKGSRQFHVNMEGVRKLTNYDIFAKAGGAMLARAEIFTVHVTDGMLNIDFLTGIADLPRISAIEVIRTNYAIKPVADSYVRDGIYNRTNYGDVTTMDIKNNASDISARRSSYMKFQLPAATPVASAKLRIYGHNHENSNSISLHAYGVNNDTWIESGIVKSNAPLAATASLGYIAVNNVYKYYEIDVTSYVKSQQQSGDGVVSLLLNDPNNRNTRLVFNSKENAANPPQLIVVSGTPATISNTREGVEEVIAQEQEEITIFPNPAVETLNINLADWHKVKTVELLNSRSDVVYHSGDKPVQSVNIKELPTGIYFVRIGLFDGSSLVRKVLIGK